MNTPTTQPACEQAELTHALALGALSNDEMAAAAAHVSLCAECRREVESLRPVVDSLAQWPTDVLRPSVSIWDRLSQRIGGETVASADPALKKWVEPDWEEVSSGIACKLLATDPVRDRVSMLVRLDPGMAYPPHRHAGVEELHLLHGELWIDDRKLQPGDYYRAEPGSSNERVWSDTGCTCLLITSPSDTLS